MALVIDPDAEEKPPSEKETKAKPRRRAPAGKRKSPVWWWFVRWTRLAARSTTTARKAETHDCIS